ncbi:MAG TPA: thrombospondin type 3 repeat-containing protein [Sandaracinaceae bacterium LLY-WYZ-13_1]|nr:thrombospondin type 3 repeat-containing protein [Sandaracinaceae bacterium LLY-WYZ-13_1]
MTGWYDDEPVAVEARATVSSGDLAALRFELDRAGCPGHPEAPRSFFGILPRLAGTGWVSPAKPPGHDADMRVATGARLGVWMAVAGCAGAASAVPESSLDRDGDGVADLRDECPAVPEDVDGHADADGCPEANEQDRDEDGLGDRVDECPDSPEDADGFRDEDGCPDPDNDRDGVIDAEDACPAEPGDPGARGCPIPEGCVEARVPMVLPRGSVPAPASASELADVVARILNGNPQLETVVAVGVAVPSEADSDALAERRAAAAEALLTQRGVSILRIARRTEIGDTPAIRYELPSPWDRCR